ncbi:tryptophan synthase subunit alpha [Buchnera aphidicola (Astegopteryx bambusae)]|uniref:tryptophan synthase subunit alpha n=1 Tax=Buchnera aphidicola TaxID=9 RepID=UPI0031B8499E
MKTRYSKVFKNLKKNREGCFIPFVMLGDPNFNVSIKIINNIINQGVDAIELGIPFSDPLADGPIIQNSSFRAIKSNITLKKCFDILKILRKNYNDIPIGLLTYANLVFSNGIKQFYQKCKDVDLDSILIVDVPIEESDLFYKNAIENKISQIFICPPNIGNSNLKKIINMSTSYIYLLSRSGVTGINNKIFFDLSKILNKIKKMSSIPIIQGFGICSEIQIKNILNSKIDGVICGSIIVKQIEKYLHNEKKMIEKINNLTKRFKMCTKI